MRYMPAFFNATFFHETVRSFRQGSFVVALRHLRDPAIAFGLMNPSNTNRLRMTVPFSS